MEDNISFPAAVFMVINGLDRPDRISPERWDAIVKHVKSMSNEDIEMLTQDWSK